MSEAKTRHFFAGGNTSLGFFSYYGNIIAQEEADKIFILKGGPGVGKSTFIKRIGEKALEKGYDVEYFHCSSDPDSLDGIQIPARKVALIDGTAPHIVDPKTPGAVDEILNFGDFWNEGGIRAHKDEIISTNKEISSVFARSYAYLKAAAAIYESSSAIYSGAVHSAMENELTATLLSSLFGGFAGAAENGKQRSLFASALTPDGACNYLDSLLAGYQVYEFTGGLGTGEHRVLEKIKSAALERGCDIEAFYCALSPYKIDHLLIPALQAAFITSNPYHSAKAIKHRTIDMREYLKPETQTRYEEDLSQNYEEFDRCISLALATMKRAKILHDYLEALYIPNIRFEEIDLFFEKTMRRIL